MSRVGQSPVLLPESVDVRLEDNQVAVSGSRGQLQLSLPRVLAVKRQEDQLIVSRLEENSQAKALHGTFTRLIANLVTGVSTGWSKELELVGLGYRAAIEEPNLILQVGFTHPVKIIIPPDLQVSVAKNIITVTGNDKQRVGQFASAVRATKKPEPYKGKGIRYRGELVRLKPGKSAKGAA